MRAIISCAAISTILSLTSTCAMANAEIEGSTAETGLAAVKGTIDTSHDLVVRIDRDKQPFEWRTRGVGGKFQVVVEASERIPMDGGKKGHGFVITARQATSESIANIALTQGNPVVGTFSVRRQADFVTKERAVTFADIALKDGTTVSVSLRLEPKKD
jgi:hypothetical protein